MLFRSQPPAVRQSPPRQEASSPTRPCGRWPSPWPSSLESKSSWDPTHPSSRRRLRSLLLPTLLLQSRPHLATELRLQLALGWMLRLRRPSWISYRCGLPQRCSCVVLPCRGAFQLTMSFAGYLCSAFDGRGWGRRLWGRELAFGDLGRSRLRRGQVGEGVGHGVERSSGTWAPRRRKKGGS